MIVFNRPQVYGNMIDSFLAISAKSSLLEETICSNMLRLTLKWDKGLNAQPMEKILAVYLTLTNIRRDVTFGFH